MNEIMALACWVALVLTCVVTWVHQASMGRHQKALQEHREWFERRFMAEELICEEEEL